MPNVKTEKQKEIETMLDEKIKEAEGFEDFLGLVGALIFKQFLGRFVKNKISGALAGLKFWN